MCVTLEEDVVSEVASLVTVAPVVLVSLVKLVTMRTASRVKTCVELSQSQPVNP